MGSGLSHAYAEATAVQAARTKGRIGFQPVILISANRQDACSTLSKWALGDRPLPARAFPGSLFNQPNCAGVPIGNAIVGFQARNDTEHEYGDPENGVEDKTNAHSDYGDYCDSEIGDCHCNVEIQGFLRLIGDEFVVFLDQPNDKRHDEGCENPEDVSEQSHRASVLARVGGFTSRSIRCVVLRRLWGRILGHGTMLVEITVNGQAVRG